MVSASSSDGDPFETVHPFNGTAVELHILILGDGRVSAAVDFTYPGQSTNGDAELISILQTEFDRLINDHIQFRRDREGS